jgi:hypothetical protein
MDFLNAIPHKDGLDILKQKLYDKLEHGKFVLIDNLNKAYYTGDVHRIFFDSDGVLTFTFVIPKDKHLTKWNKKIRILTADNKIITEVVTPEIQFVEGVGGEQVLKLAVSGNAGDIIFKKDDYLTEYEAIDLLLVPHWEQISSLQLSILKDEINSLEKDKQIESKINSIFERLEDDKKAVLEYIERMDSQLYKLITTN